MTPERLAEIRANLGELWQEDQPVALELVEALEGLRARVLGVAAELDRRSEEAGCEERAVGYLLAARLVRRCL